MKNYKTLAWLILFFSSTALFGQVVNTTPVNLVGSSDPIPGPGGFLGHPFTPSPLTGTYHGGTFFGGTRERWGYNISGLTPGENYTLTVYYMMDVVFGTPGGNRIGNLTMNSGAPLDVTTIPYVVPANWRNWYTLTTTFTATGTTDRIDIEADGISDNSIWLFTDMSITGDPACDELTVTVSTSELCLGDELTLTAVSDNGGTITWDGGATNGTPFVPATAGTITYNATSSSPDDCEFSVDIVVNDLPAVTATADDTELCIGESVTLTAGGADTYVWDGGVTDGVTFTPDATALYTVTGTDANGCENTSNITVTVLPLPDVNAGDDIIVCDAESIILAGSGADTYVWDGGITDGVAFIPTETTLYTVTGTTVAGCQNTDDITVTVGTTPTVDAGEDVTICVGESVTLSATGAATYVWDGGITDGVTFTPTETATYTVTGMDAVGCDNTDNVTVTVASYAVVNAGADVTICEGNPVTLNGIITTGSGVGLWDGGVSNGVAFNPSETATYTYTVTTPAGCVSTDEITVNVNPMPIPVFTADETQGCLPLEVNFRITSLEAVSYTWDFGDGTTGTEDPISHIYNAEGLYDVTLTAVSSEGCIGVTSYDDYIRVANPPVADFLFSEVESSEANNTIIFDNESVSATEYTWSFDDESSASFTENPIHSFPMKNGKYLVELKAENDLGCVDSIEKLILVKEKLIFYVPNAFTPDGDLLNNSFKPVFSSGLNVYDYHLTIFNRWGEILFESYDVNYGWNGTVGNRELVEDGTYIWMIEFGETMSDKLHIKRGDVILIK